MNNILKHLKTDVWITRTELCQLTGVSDRKVRDAISKLRKLGYRIVSSDKREGYKLASSNQEYNALLQVYKSRIKDEIETLSQLTSVEDVQIFVNNVVMDIKEQRERELNDILEKKECTLCMACKVIGQCVLYDVPDEWVYCE